VGTSPAVGPFIESMRKGRQMPIAAKLGRRLLPVLLPLGTLAVLLALERRRPLRRGVEDGWRREARNLVVGLASGLAIHFTEKPLVSRLAEGVQRHGWGLLPRLRLPAAAEAAIALALLDYTLFLWHILLHRVPLLWRCHLVHHADLDLTASTGLRFHAAEMVLSAPWRAGQVGLIGVRPRVLAAWQLAALLEILFHHANLRLPARFERRLGRLIMTPRLHGIHHSTVRDETASNWSSGLVLWDWLHGTLRHDVPQRAIAIGVPAYRDPGELRLPGLLALPFRAQRPAWAPPASRGGRLSDAIRQLPHCPKP
jgi:sterol desaturase/sphingolipid hydroxylase (fatty acid hydroxylase superfamily)